MHVQRPEGVDGSRGREFPGGLVEDLTLSVEKKAQLSNRSGWRRPASVPSVEYDSAPPPSPPTPTWCPRSPPIGSAPASLFLRPCLAGVCQGGTCLLRLFNFSAGFFLDGPCLPACLACLACLAPPFFPRCRRYNVLLRSSSFAHSLSILDFGVVFVAFVTLLVIVFLLLLFIEPTLL